MAKGKKISLMSEHTGALTGTKIPLVDSENQNKVLNGEKLVQLNEEGKIDESLLPENSSGDGGIYVVDEL